MEHQGSSLFTQMGKKMVILCEFWKTGDTKIITLTKKEEVAFFFFFFFSKGKAKYNKFRILGDNVFILINFQNSAYFRKR